MKDAINKAKRPLIYAGHGCTLYRAQFLAFIDELNIPVLLSWRAIDLIPDDHLLNYGRPGMFSTPKIANLLDDADMVLILGARIDDSLTDYGKKEFSPNAKKIVVDIDKAELDRLPDDYIKVCQDVGEFMRELQGELE